MSKFSRYKEEGYYQNISNSVNTKTITYDNYGNMLNIESDLNCYLLEKKDI